MKNFKHEVAQRSNNMTTVRITPAKPQEVAVSIEDLPSQSNPTEETEEEMEKKAKQTVYAKLKQVACCQDRRKVKRRWKHIEELFKRPQYKRDKKKIIEKLDDENNYAPLHYAVRSNNLVICQRLIEYECNVNLLGWDGQSSLHLAACSSKIEKDLELFVNGKKRDDGEPVLLFLLRQKNIKIDMQDDKGRTPLHHAIMRQHSHIVEKLLSKGAKADITDIQGANAVHYAYRYEKESKLYLKFKDHEKLLGKKTVDNKTPFELATKFGNLDAIRKYLDADPTSPVHSEYGLTALIPGAVHDQHMKFLGGLSSDSVNSDLVLRIVCQQPNIEQLLEHINIKTLFTKETIKKCISPEALTLLMIAVIHGRKNCVKELLKVEYCDKNILEVRSYAFDRTVLHMCAEYPHDDITPLLLGTVVANGLDLTPIDVMGDTPLHICAQKDNTYMSEELLSQRSNTDRRVNNATNFPQMLRIRNNNGLTAFHEAIENGRLEIFRQMLNVMSDPKQLIEQPDDQLRTSLHAASLRGNVEMVNILIYKGADVEARDINDHTPLHEAARWSDSLDEENDNRVECMELLIKANADVNALNIFQESPLHIACRYGSSTFVKCLLKHRADLLRTNANGLNCLEVAIEEKNTEIVKYLIGHDYIFELLRNAQLYEKHRILHGSSGKRDSCMSCYHSVDTCFGLDRYKASTPMRKLIISMPDMALEVLNKCITTIGKEHSKVHRQFYSYEFLDDQYAVGNWYKGNLKYSADHFADQVPAEERAISHKRPYTRDYKTLVKNHPLFLMAEYDRYELMHHPVSKSLVNQKFFGISFSLFVLSFALYATFLGLYTTIVLRTQHPQYFYNLTGFDFDSSLCRNVTQALGNTATKQTADTVFKNAMYAFFGLIVAKNSWGIIGYLGVDWSKIFTFLLEIISIALNFYFVYDYDYQVKYTMRCPLQWQLGAVGLLVGYIALFYYIQYVPIFGIYVIMIRQVLIRFLLFLPVFLVLICGFALTLYMVFQNFDAFKSVPLSLVKTVIMSTGEITYDDLMSNDMTKAYYIVAYVLLILFVVVLTILVSNLLIGLAVGEIGPLMTAAKDTRMDMFYELAADFEILKFQFLSVFGRCCGSFCFIAPSHYKQDDLTTHWKWYRNLKKKLRASCAREVDKDDLSDSDDDGENDYPTRLLEDVRKGIQVLQAGSHKDRSKSASNQAAGSHTIVGVKPKNGKNRY